MDIQGWVTVGLCAVWLATEVNFGVRNRARERSENRDKLSLLLMRATTVVSIAFAVSVEFAPAIVCGAGRISALSSFLGYFGCLVMVVGLVIRLRATATLGKQFTVDVAIVQNHKIIEKGLYGAIRHPIYLGSLVTFAGLGLAPGLAPVLWTVNVPSRNDGTRFGGYSKYHPTL